MVSPLAARGAPRSGEEKRLGAYEDYAYALKEWRARSMAEIDDVQVRYRIAQV